MKKSWIVSAALVAVTAALAAGVNAQPADVGSSAVAGLNWRLLGPFRGGWSTVVEGVPNQPDTFYFGAAGGGVWRTRDAGRTWQPIFEHAAAASVGALAVSPSNPDVIYVGTGQPEPRYDVAAGLGVFKSVDGGASWTSLGLADTRTIGKIWIDPKNPDLVLVAAQGHFFGPSAARGVYRSTDGGKTWTHVLQTGGFTGAVDLASDPNDPRILFASTWEARQFPWQSYFTPITGKGSAIYKSVDEGSTWTRLSGGGWPNVELGRIGLAVTHSAGGTRVYAAVDSKEAGGLYRSDDGGGHWTRVNDETAFTNWYASRLTVAPNDPDTVYTVGQSIRRCTQAGKTCEIIKGAPGGDDYHHIWINPLHPDHMITGSDQGTVVSVDGGATWSSWYNQPTGQFYHLATDNRFPYWIYSGQQDSGTVAIASRSDYGAITLRDWHPVGGDERDYDVPDPADPDIVYGSGLGGRVTRFDAHTGQVKNVSPWPVSSYGKRPTLVRYHYLWMTPLVASPTNPPSLYLGAQVLFRSTDRGEHWNDISGDVTGKDASAKDCGGIPALAAAKSCGYGTISAIAPAPQDAREIWVGTDDGLIKLTRDGGAHWSDITPKSTAIWDKIASLDVSRLRSGTAYVAVDGHRLDDFAPHILRTEDYGRSWQDISGDLPPAHFADVVRADPLRAGLLYVGTDAGAFVSADDGAHWTVLGRNLPTAWVTDLLVHGDDLIAATEGRAIWVLDDVSPLRESVPVSANAHLFAPAVAFRVHPNNNADTPLPPESPIGSNPPAGAVIDYWLGEKTSGPVTLEIHDASGALVRRFASNDKPQQPNAERYFAAGWTKPPQMLSAAPGFHRFVWNLRYERPQAIDYSYGIGAVWGEAAPIAPEGPYVLPGRYEVVLAVGGQRSTASLLVREDPRIKTSAQDLKASLDLSIQIAHALAENRVACGEQQAVAKQVQALFPAQGGNSAKAPDALKTLADRILQKPAVGEPTFTSIDSILVGIETDLEAVDSAPTAAQRAVVSDTLLKLAQLERDWSAMKSGPLAQLNAQLKNASRKQIVIPPPDHLDVEAEEGDDLP